MNLVIFASGAGSNALKIHDYLKNNIRLKIKLLVCNNATASVVGHFKKRNIEVIIVNKVEIGRSEFIKSLTEKGINGIILAGFLLKIPLALIEKYENRILNIHPSLLPKYGGKGMYGMNVHNAVLENKEKESGITIHIVTENFDEGPQIFQAKTDISDCKTAEEISEKVRILEHQHFPEIVEKYFSSLGNQ